MIQDFADLMPHTVIVNAFRRYSTDGLGFPTYSTAGSTYQARVVAGRVHTIGSSGYDVVATHTMWLATTATIGVQSKVSFLGSTYAIVDMHRVPDEFGTHHTKMLLRA